MDGSIFNIVYYFKEGWQYNIYEIKPKPENLAELKFGLTKKIDGTVSKIFQSYQGQSSENCSLVSYWIEDCHGCPPGDCDGCFLCLKHKTVLVCGEGPVDLYISDAPSYGLGGGGVGGGANTNIGPTNPNPPSNPVTNNEEEIATTPVIRNNFLDVPAKNPCSELKKITTNNAVQLNLKILKEAADRQTEVGYYMRESTNAAGVPFTDFPVIPPDPNNPNMLNIVAGLSSGKVKGAMHCHTDPASTNMIPMFSAEDLGALYGIADAHVPANNAEKDYAEYTVILSVASGHYALKFNNFGGDYNGNFNKNFQVFDKELKKEYKALGANASSSALMKAFLKILKSTLGSEVGVYKATETTDPTLPATITGWQEQTLNEAGTEIVPINCP